MVKGGHELAVLLNIFVEPLAEGGFIATSHDLPVLVAQERTVAKTFEIAQQVAVRLVESFLEQGDELPQRLRAARTAEAEVGIPIALP